MTGEQKTSRVLRNSILVHAWSVIVLIGLICLAQSILAATKNPSVPVVGLDKDGQSIVNFVPFPEYRGTMTLVFSSVRDSIIPALKNRTTTAAARVPSWHLQTIGVGVGLTGSIGLGPIWNLTGFGRLRLIFANCDNPLYPD